MFKEILDSLNAATAYKEGDMLSPLSKGYVPLPLTFDKFHAISSLNTKPVLATRLCFVDGGSAELITAPNFSLSFIRAYAHVMLNNKTLDEKKIEFYCLAKTKVKEKKIYYEVRFFSTEGIELNTDNDHHDDYNHDNYHHDNEEGFEDGFYSALPDKDDLEIFSFDSSLSVGENRVEISRLNDVVRRFTELRLGAIMTNDLKQGDVIILDGNLRATFINEQKYLDKLYEKASAKNILVTALAKTSTLLTESGNNIISVISHMANSAENASKLNSICWYYFPLFQISDPKHRAELMFVKINAISEYIFRFEIFVDASVPCADQHKLCTESIFDAEKSLNFEKLNDILSLLEDNSRDYSFPGYPYGLVKADQIARVSNHEKEYLRSKIMFSLGDDRQIAQCLKAMDAHDVLDR